METVSESIEPRALNLFYSPPGTLRLTIREKRSFHTVKLYQAWPLSRPGRHVSLCDGKGDEITLLESLDHLHPASRAVAEEELQRRYLTAHVEEIQGVRTEFGVTYWHVRTDRGDRDFVVQSMTDSCTWLSDVHLLITDVDGNRFEIVDRSALDALSRTKLDLVL